MVINIEGKTNVGLVRSHNEDDFIIGLDAINDKWENSGKNIKVGNSGIFIVIADGMGGMEAGEIASKIAINTAKKEFQKISTEFPENNFEIVNILKDIAIKAHDNIIADFKKNPDRKGMGTTILLSVIINNSAYIAWCGDSRAYRFNKNGINPTRHFDLKELEIITNDHSLVWEYVQSGNMTAEEARVHSHSNIITQSLGNESKHINPDVTIVKLNKGDRLLFCSDGLNSMVSDQKISDILKLNKTTKRTCDLLIKEALKQGGYDNITICLLDVVEIDLNLKSNNDFQNETQATFYYHKNPFSTFLLKYKIYLILFAVTFIGIFFYELKYSEESIKQVSKAKKTLTPHNDSTIKETRTKNIGTNNNYTSYRNEGKNLQTPIVKRETKDPKIKKIENLKIATYKLITNVNKMSAILKTFNTKNYNTKQKSKYNIIISEIDSLSETINSYFDNKTSDFKYKLENLEPKMKNSDSMYNNINKQYKEFITLLINENPNKTERIYNTNQDTAKNNIKEGKKINKFKDTINLNK